MSLGACYNGIEPFVRLFASGSPGARVLEFDSVVGTLIPSSPKRSLFNTVVFDRDDPQKLADALPNYIEVVDASGVEACSVWVVEGDEEAEQIVRAAGFSLDSTPRAMGAPLNGFDLDAAFDDVVERWDMAEVARLNEDAYGLDRGEFGAVLEPIAESESSFCFLTLKDDRPVASVMTLHTYSGDCTVYFVATDPEHRRAGHATRAMLMALRHARENGCDTTTLQATKHGAPVYLKLGYDDLGVAVNLWERRTA